MTERKQQILETTAEILEQKSFAAFSYQDLADRLGVTKASIHYHFPTKDDLGVALLEHFEVAGDELWAKLAQSAETPGALCAAMLDLAEAVMLDHEFRVCPAFAFTVDSPALSERMRAALLRLAERHDSHVAEMLEAARNAGELSFLGDARDQAQAVAAALQGASQLATLCGRDFFRSVVRQLKRSMGL